jgi:hypothetical protein
MDTALQFKQDALMTLTIRSLALEAPHELLLLVTSLVTSLKLQAYAPKYTTLIDPP